MQIGLLYDPFHWQFRAVKYQEIFLGIQARLDSEAAMTLWLLILQLSLISHLLCANGIVLHPTSLLQLTKKPFRTHMAYVGYMYIFAFSFYKTKRRLSSCICVFDFREFLGKMLNNLYATNKVAWVLNILNQVTTHIILLIIFYNIIRY